MKPRAAHPFIVFALFTWGCGSSGASTGALPTVEMKIGAMNFVLEIAASRSAEEKGLMQRDSMDSNHGMIFVFESEKPLSFWMKDTRIPLDILFLDKTGKVVSIHQMQPYDTITRTESGGDAKYAIELNRGAAALANVSAGDRLELPAMVRETKGAG